MALQPTARYQKAARLTPDATQPTAPQTAQVLTRPLTDTERASLSHVYHGHQIALRFLGVMALALFILNTYILSDFFIDESVTFVLYVTMFLAGLGTLLLSLRTVPLRKKITAAAQTGTAVDVYATAHRAGAARNAATWTIGPITLKATPEAIPLLSEGTPVKAVCIPLVNTVLSLNDHSLRYGARMKYHPEHVPQATHTTVTPPPTSTQEDIGAIEKAIDNAIASDERLARLKDLRDKGLITEQDYEQKKKQILIEI